MGILRSHLRDEPGGNGNHDEADDVMDVFFSPRVHSDAAVERIGSEPAASESVQHLKDSAKGNNNTKKCCIASVCLLGRH